MQKPICFKQDALTAKLPAFSKASAFSKAKAAINKMIETFAISYRNGSFTLSNICVTMKYVVGKTLYDLARDPKDELLFMQSKQKWTTIVVKSQEELSMEKALNANTYLFGIKKFRT